ncbi:hypothetical protein JN531_012260 [Flagellatimonas centrodinii]|nr:hypothetical protein [Flagellatimonas centrodinii]ULQ45874.1 hypothetical protein JN531_012260 [Flagellatimonas centrodinii]
MAFDRISPIGDERGDVLMASLQAHMQNLKRRRGQRAGRIRDYQLKWGRRRAQPVSEMLNMAKMITAACGGEVR